VEEPITKREDSSEGRRHVVKKARRNPSNEGGNSDPEAAAVTSASIIQQLLQLAKTLPAVLPSKSAYRRASKRRARAKEGSVEVERESIVKRNPPTESQTRGKRPRCPPVVTDSEGEHRQQETKGKERATNNKASDPILLTIPEVVAQSSDNRSPPARPAAAAVPRQQQQQGWPQRSHSYNKSSIQSRQNQTMHYGARLPPRWEVTPPQHPSPGWAWGPVYNPYDPRLESSQNQSQSQNHYR
jgi:hypothetical protein